MLAQEGVEIHRGSLGERTVDIRLYGWFPNQLPSHEGDGDDDVGAEGEDEQRLFV